MAEFPALPLQTEKFLADTRHLTTQQVGAYMLMLMMAWRQEDNSLPNDDEYLARITGLGKKTWEKNKGTLLEFWKLKVNNRWSQKKLDDVKFFVQQKRKQNSQAGIASALKRKETASTDVIITLQHGASINPTYNSHSNSSKEVSKKVSVEREDAREDEKPPGKPPPNPPDFEIKNFDDAFAGCCLLLGVKALSRADQELLASWYDRGDFVSHIVPLMKEKTAKFMQKNGGKAPKSLAYFAKAVDETMPTHQIISGLAMQFAAPP